MTIKDVAAYCGVSITTVSRVLNNHPDVRDSVREKVLKAVQELHYIPNASARDLGKAQEDTIGVILRGAANPFLTSVLRSVALHQIGTDDDEVAAGAGLVRAKRLRGLIFLGGSFDYTPERVADLGVPYVCCTFTATFGSVDKAAYSSVSIDDYATAYEAVKRLTDVGHRRIGVLLGSTADRSISELRYRGYLAALRDAGIEPDPAMVAESGSFEMADVYEATRCLIARRRDITALFTISDLMGVAAIKALHSDGVRVPQDCSVISIDGLEITKYTVPTLTTLAQPGDVMGAEAVRILVSVLKGVSAHTHLRLSTTLREGETVQAISV